MKLSASIVFSRRVPACAILALTLLVPGGAFAQQTTDAAAAVLIPENKAAASETATAISKPKLAPEDCTIKNFGKVAEHYFRGAQPKPEQYTQLADLGVKTVIDLRDDAESFAKTKAQAAGLNYLNLPMSDTVYPKQETIDRFLELAKDPANFPIYVHCKGGRHRTGVVTAVYRMTYEGWNIEKAYEEMKDYDFYTRWGHKQMKTFVFDYWKTLQSRPKQETSTVVAPASVSHQ